MHVDSCGILRAPVPGLIVSLGIDVELEQEGLDIYLVLDGQKSSLEFLSYGQLLVAVSLAWCLSYSSASLLGSGPLLILFWPVTDPLAFASAVFLTPPILFSVPGFISHSTFWLFHHPGLDVLDVGWISLSGLLLDMLDLSDGLLESSAIFWAITTRARI